MYALRKPFTPLEPTCTLTRAMATGRRRPKKLPQYSERSQKGLYAGKDVRFGHSISFSDKKHKRKFKPNVITKRLWSESLNRWLRFDMTTKALRMTDKYGGIDNYLLQTDDSHLNSSQGLAAKRAIEEAMLEQQAAADLIQAKILELSNKETKREASSSKPQGD
ncbi:unnamed protein product [Chrysoparadoxa australica]